MKNLTKLERNKKHPWDVNMITGWETIKVNNSAEKDLKKYTMKTESLKIS